jgi:hypothetical protein
MGKLNIKRESFLKYTLLFKKIILRLIREGNNIFEVAKTQY